MEVQHEKVDGTQDANLEQKFTTFFIGERLYGIDVMKVQEITKQMDITRVPLAPNYVYGLINLRGQIATAIGLRELLEIPGEKPSETMNVVCEVGGLLLSLVVDRIGDVIEVKSDTFENSPDNLPKSVQRFMSGIYKLDKQLLSILELDKISKLINGKLE